MVHGIRKNSGHKKNEQNYKPGYVVGNHLSRSDVTA